MIDSFDKGIIETNKKHLEDVKQKLSETYDTVMKYIVDEAYAFGYLEGVEDGAANADVARFKAAAKVMKVLADVHGSDGKLDDILNDEIDKMRGKGDESNTDL